MSTKHKHHILPKHAGGTNHPSNIEYLTVQEHAAFHYERWVLVGNIYDYIAWMGLSKRFGKEEIFKELSRNNAKKYVKENNPFWGKKHTEKTKEHLRKINLGSNNPMFGKKITQKQIDAMKRNRIHTKEQHYKIALKHMKPVYINGIFFKSIKEASTNLGIYPSVLRYRLKSSNFPNWYYTQKDSNEELCSMDHPITSRTAFNGDTNAESNCFSQSI